MQQLGQTLAVMANKFDDLSNGLSGVPASLESSLREMRQQFESEQETTRRRQSEAGDQMAAQLSELAEKLSGVTGQFSDDLAIKLQETIKAATDTSGEAIGSAFAKFGEKMTKSSNDLVERLGLLANTAAPLSEAMTKAAEATNQQAQRLEAAGRSTEEAGSKLSAAVSELNSALNPVALLLRFESFPGP